MMNTATLQFTVLFPVQQTAGTMQDFTPGTRAAVTGTATERTTIQPAETKP